MTVSSIKEYYNMVVEMYSLLMGEDPEFIDEFLSNKKEDLIQYHSSTGRFIRNHYRLWEKKWEPEMVDGSDHSPHHPDAISMRVIESVWEKGNSQYQPPEVS